MKTRVLFSFFIFLSFFSPQSFAMKRRANQEIVHNRPAPVPVHRIPVLDLLQISTDVWWLIGNFGGPFVRNRLRELSHHFYSVFRRPSVLPPFAVTADLAIHPEWNDNLSYSVTHFEGRLRSEFTRNHNGLIYIVQRISFEDRIAIIDPKQENPIVLTYKTKGEIKEFHAIRDLLFVVSDGVRLGQNLTILKADTLSPLYQDQASFVAWQHIRSVSRHANFIYIHCQSETRVLSITNDGIHPLETLPITHIVRHIGPFVYGVQTNGGFYSQGSFFVFDSSKEHEQIVEIEGEFNANLSLLELESDLLLLSSPSGNHFVLNTKKNHQTEKKFQTGFILKEKGIFFYKGLLYLHCLLGEEDTELVVFDPSRDFEVIHRRIFSLYQLNGETFFYGNYIIVSSNLPRFGGGPPPLRFFSIGSYEEVLTLSQENLPISLSSTSGLIVHGDFAYDQRCIEEDSCGPCFGENRPSKVKYFDLGTSGQIQGHEIEVGPCPFLMFFHGNLLYVVCAEDHTLSVVDPEQNHAVISHGIQVFPRPWAFGRNNLDILNYGQLQIFLAQGNFAKRDWVRDCRRFDKTDENSPNTILPAALALMDATDHSILFQLEFDGPTSNHQIISAFVQNRFLYVIFQNSMFAMDLRGLSEGAMEDGPRNVEKKINLHPK